MKKSINDVFSDWITLQIGGKDSLDEKVVAWLAINSLTGSTEIHQKFRRFLDARVSASNIECDPTNERHQDILDSLRNQFLTLNYLCRESVSDDELQTYQVLYA